MSIKAKLEYCYEHLYDVVRRYSAQKKRIKQFKNKSDKKTLNKAQINAVKEFYKPYKIPNMVFHRYFTEKTGEFCINYIPQDVYICIDTFYNDLKAARYIDNKCYYDLLFNNIKQPYLVLKRMNNIWLDNAGNRVRKDEIKSIIESEETGIFLKVAQSSSGGFGVVCVDSSEKAYDKLVEFMNKRKEDDIVIQRRIYQHKDCARFNESSVNSLRIYSVLHKDGEVKIYSAVMRIGVGESRVDNFSSGGVACGIDEDGVLRKYAYDKDGIKMEKHPTSGVVFEGCKIPCWEEAVKLVKKAHLKIPHFRSVSWDVAITEDGTPVMIETNLCRGGIDLLQVCNGPLYGTDTKKILDEVFEKK